MGEKLQKLWIRITKRRPIKRNDSLPTINELDWIYSFFQPFLMSHFLSYVHVRYSFTVYERMNLVHLLIPHNWTDHRHYAQMFRCFFFSFRCHWFSIYNIYIDDVEFLNEIECIVFSSSFECILYKHLDSTFLLLLFSFTPSSDPLHPYINKCFQNETEKRNENILLGNDKYFVEKHCGKCAKEERTTTTTFEKKQTNQNKTKNKTEWIITK